MLVKEKCPLASHNNLDNIERLTYLAFYWLQDGNEVFFRIKRSTQLKKLMNAYCDRQSVDFNSIAFLFDGRRLRGEQTPDEVPLSDPCSHIKQKKELMIHNVGLLLCFILCALVINSFSLTTFLPCFSWRWRMAMKLMQCCIKLEAQLFEASHLFCF